MTSPSPHYYDLHGDGESWEDGFGIRLPGVSISEFGDGHGGSLSKGSGGFGLASDVVNGRSPGWLCWPIHLDRPASLQHYKLRTP